MSASAPKIFKPSNYQNRMAAWAITTFGTKIVNSLHERIDRVVEEAVELAQAMDMPKEVMLKIVDYVYSRPKGEVRQEIGGLLATISVLCSTLEFDIDEVKEEEYARIITKVKKIREKDKLKPKFSQDASDKPYLHHREIPTGSILPWIELLNDGWYIVRMYHIPHNNGMKLVCGITKRNTDVYLEASGNDEIRVFRELIDKANERDFHLDKQSL